VIVVSDTSAIVNLAAVGQLDVLHQLYGTVIIPPAVQSEIATGGPNAPGAATTSMAWIQTVPVTNRSLVAELAGQLDLGEAEAVALALETRADLLLPQESGARRGQIAPADERERAPTSPPRKASRLPTNSPRSRTL